MGLSSSDFSKKPEGVDALVWGLKNRVINEQDYVNWASDFYQIPAIKPEFFSMAVDFTLVEKYANVFDWTPHCYPIYKWEDTLFVACLEPPKNGINLKSCFVIAPFTPLESAWQKNQNSNVGIPQPTESLPVVEMPKTEPAQEPIPVEAAQPEPVVDEQTTEKIVPPQELKQPEQPEVIVPPAPAQEPVAEQVPVQEAAAPAEEASPAQEEKPHEPMPTADVGGLDFGNLTQEMGISPDEVLAEEGPAEPQQNETVGELDFSAMDGAGGKAPEEAAQEQPAQEQPAHEMTHTSIDGEGFNGLTSATQTMHANAGDLSPENHTQTQAMAFDNLSIGDMALEGEATKIDPPQMDETKVNPSAPPIPDVKPQPVQTKQQAAEPVAKQKPQPQPVEVPKQEVIVPAAEAPAPTDDALPSLDDLVAKKTENPQQAPGLETPELTTDEVAVPNAAFVDDYTPVPVITKAQQEAQAKRKIEAQQQKVKSLDANMGENTITDHSQPVHTPPENEITDADLQKSDELETSDSMKLVVAHLFGHLMRDYKKLMWIELGEEGHYFPKYVLGDWKVITLAWKMHINITNPNMFRIAYKSGLPFHGEVQANPHNEKYFEWWTRGKSPNFVTIFPVVIDERLVGFITGFDKNTEFDEVGSLKKIENLISICKKSFQKFSAQKAA